MGRLALGLFLLALPSLASAQSAEETVAYIIGGIEATAITKLISSSPAEYETTVQTPDVQSVTHTVISAIDTCHYRFVQTSEATIKGKRMLVALSRDYDFSGASPALRIDEAKVAGKTLKKIVIPGLKATNCSFRIQQPEDPPSPVDGMMKNLLIRQAQSDCNDISQGGMPVGSYSIERAAQSFAEFRNNSCRDK